MPRFDAPIHTERPGALDPTSKPVHCTCPGWCRGRSSADWLTCSLTCKACNPTRRRRRAVNGREGDDAQAD